MTAGYPRPSPTVRSVLDLLFAAWVVAWLLIGLSVAREVTGLGELADTVGVAGGALQQTGQVLGSFAELPFFGGQVEELGERIGSAGAEAQVEAAESKVHVDRLSRLLGLAVAIVPTVPLALLYLPLRIGWRRETRGLRRLLREAGDEAALERLLAVRAVQTLPIARLRGVSADPLADLEAGRTRALADAELARLGIRRPPRQR